MGDPFDKNDPWHVQADFVLMFYCETKSCNALIDVGDLSDEQKSLDWPDLCVALSDVARSRGWTCIGNLQFLCPSCSAARLEV
jgi:hypothetical protein